ncbi:TolC family outer membrane protein [Sulfurimonas sp.]
MLKKGFISLTLMASVLSVNTSAYTLQQSIVEALNTNPVIQERLKNFRATQQDLHIAESEYYPQIDLAGSVGRTAAGNIKTSGTSDFNHAVNDVTYNSYESSLTFTQNLFDGFGTMHKVDYEEARILAAAYKYLEVANETARQITEAYLEVLKTRELVGTASENVNINETIYSNVKDLFESGLTTDSEVKKIQSTLSLARSNLTVKKNNARDAEFKYRRILGRFPDAIGMEKPILDVKMPESREKAALYTINNNPSILVSKYNIQGAQALWKQRKKDYYPKLDLEISQSFNDHDEVGNGFDSPDDRFKARLVLSYNLFRGGADEATIQQHISKVHQEIEIQRDLKRQAIEDLDLSWSAYYMVEDQVKDLREYSEFSEKTLELYKEEYDLGRRSLLDLLSAQNDVINSRSEIIIAEYSQLSAQYRILDAMGLLVVAVNGSANEFSSKVNLFTDDDAHEILDTLPVERDVDKDEVSDNIDLCDNSLLENNIMPYGCKKRNLIIDNDRDGVADEDDMCPTTPRGDKVDKTGCTIVQDLDDDNDGVLNENDECPTTPMGDEVDSSGCTIAQDLDDDNDGVLNENDDCPTTPMGDEVDARGCTIAVPQKISNDNDQDGVINANDACPTTPRGYKVDVKGCAVSMTLHINFAVDSSYLPDTAAEKINRFTSFLKENPQYNIKIVGYTSDVGDFDYNDWLSKRRAKRIRSALEANGIDGSRMSSQGRGERDPVADNATEEGRSLNRRVEVELMREGQ